MVDAESARQYLGERPFDRREGMFRGGLQFWVYRGSHAPRLQPPTAVGCSRVLRVRIDLRVKVEPETSNIRSSKHPGGDSAWPHRRIRRQGVSACYSVSSQRRMSLETWKR